MGFRPGTQVTVDNALKMMMVKSANDMAVVLAEGVGGSIDGFSAMMNQTAQKLGMTQTSYVNPNGLPADGQITSARDLAILARAIIRDLPEYEYFVHIPSIRYGRRVTQNFNKLIGRYPGADGFKTGFICASGYNLVASATRNGKRLIAVVLGASSGSMRAVRAAQLLERGFANNAAGLAEARARHRRQPGSDRCDAAEPARRDVQRQAQAPGHRRGRRHRRQPTAARSGESAVTFFTAGLPAAGRKPSDMLAAAPPAVEPVLVYTGPTRDRRRPDRRRRRRTTEKQTPPKRAARRSQIAAKKPDAAARQADQGRGGQARKPSQAPSRQPSHANAKPEAAAKAGAKPRGRQGRAKLPSRRPLPSPRDKPAAADGATKPAAKGRREAEPVNGTEATPPSRAS